MSVPDRPAIRWETHGGSRGFRFVKIMLKSALRGGLFGLFCAAVWQVWRAVTL